MKSRQIFKPRLLKCALWCGVVLLLLGSLAGYFYSEYTPSQTLVWGVTFSPPAAEYLGLDWKQAYLAMLQDLSVKYVRIPVYWDRLEPKQGAFSYEEVDWMLQQAAQYHAQVILGLGRKQPRWPECHNPAWFNSLSSAEQQKATLDMLTHAVLHFKASAAVEVWQVENEPDFKFGPDCEKTPIDFLTTEVTLVRLLDSHPTLVTDSGEIGHWLPVAGSGADYFGSTMYRVVHNKFFGYITYPLPPLFFKIKAGILNSFAAPKKIWGVELQAEPWFVTDALHTPIPEQLALMNPELLAQNIAYARAVGFERNYLWGVEWWYWLKTKHDNPVMWDAAEKLYK